MAKARFKLLLVAGLIAARASAQDQAPTRDPDIAEVVRGLTLLELNEDRGLQRLNELSAIEKESQTRATLQGKIYVRLARVGLFPLGGGFDKLLRHAQNLERLRHSIERDIAREKDSVRERVAIRLRLGEISASRSKYVGQESAMRAAELALVAARERESAFQSAFGNGAARGTTVYGAPATEPLDPAELSRGFEVMQGRLPFPITGRSEIVAAQREQGARKGLEMSARLGASVRAVYPGKVVFADSYADYGTTVIVDHGGAYFSVSANLGQVDVRVGEQVSTGTRIGAVGAAERGAFLYFELRRAGADLDPAGWFGI